MLLSVMEVLPYGSVRDCNVVFKVLLLNNVNSRQCIVIVYVTVLLVLFRIDSIFPTYFIGGIAYRVSYRNRFFVGSGHM